MNCYILPLPYIPLHDDGVKVWTPYGILDSPSYCEYKYLVDDPAEQP